MANGRYVNYANLILGDGVHSLPDWPSDTIKLIGVDAADYTVSLAAHQDLADVPSGARVFVATILTPSVSGGIVDAPDITVPSVTGDQIEALIYYKHTGTESTSPLMCYLDDCPAGMPLTPNGGDVEVVFDAEGIIGF